VIRRRIHKEIETEEKTLDLYEVLKDNETTAEEEATL